MKRATLAIAATLLLGTTIVACGDDGGGGAAASFGDQIDDVCRDLDRALKKLPQAQNVADVKGLASDASTSYEDAVAEMQKIKLPSDKGDARDAKDLIAGFEDQIDLLDQMSKAAGNDDVDTLTTKLKAFTDIADANADLADNLDAKRCAIDTSFTDFADAPVDTVDTTPVDTTPVDTTPVTAPPETQPPSTAPPETQPNLETNKVSLDAASFLVPAGNFSFQDAPADTLSSWNTLLDLSSLIKPQPGTIGGVDVFDGTGANIGRVFFMVADTTLTPGSIEDLIPIVSSGALNVPATIGGVPGLKYESNGLFFFLASRDDVIVWVLSGADANLDPTLSDFFASLGA